MRFIDEVTVKVRAGDGGDGAISWRREAHVPQGGPDGGNGGNGGAVIFKVKSGLNTLIDFSFSPLLGAERGENGQGSIKDGANGKDLICAVPAGTEVYFQDELVADLKTPDSLWVAAKGGMGGKGNYFYKSSTRQAPHVAQKGGKGENLELKLVLKSVADVGLVGIPNSGKSTLISKISKASPKIADYAFTTLRPNLGVVLVNDSERFVVADIPGLIEGAHEGKGLGIQFLKHIERTKALAQLIDISEEDELKHLSGEELAAIEDDKIISLALAQFRTIDDELKNFSAEVHSTPRIIVFSKCDKEIQHRAFALTKNELKKIGLESLMISSTNGEGLEELIISLNELLKTADNTYSKL